MSYQSLKLTAGSMQYTIAKQAKRTSKKETLHYDHRIVSFICLFAEFCNRLNYGRGLNKTGIANPLASSGTMDDLPK